MEQLIKTPADNDLDFYVDFFFSTCKRYDDFYEPVQDYFEDGAGKDSFKPLEFWNLFWHPFNFIHDSFKQGASNRFTIVEELQTLPLTDREKHIIFGMILKFYGGYPCQKPHADLTAAITLCLLERAFLSFKPNTPEKKFCRINGSDDTLDYYDKAEVYQYGAKDFESISARNEFDFYFDIKNIYYPTLVFDTLKYFEVGKRKGYVEPLAFLNLLWPQVDKIHKIPKKPNRIVEELNALPLHDKELRHVLLGFILKWYSGYPVGSIALAYNEDRSKDHYTLVLKMIQKEFLNYEGDTPEKDYCLKEEERQKRINDDKAKKDAEIDREKYSNSEPAALITSAKTRNIKETTKILYQQIATFYNGRAKPPKRTNARFDKAAIDTTIKHFYQITGKTYSPKNIQDAINWFKKNVTIK